MKNNNYTIKEYSFNGINYIRTPKNVAQKRIANNDNLKYFLVGSNVNTHHFHSGWTLAAHPKKLDSLTLALFASPNDTKLDVLTKEYNSFKFNLDNELGRYPVYYVEKQ